MRKSLCFVCFFVSASLAAGQTTADFEAPILGPNSAYYGQDGAGGFASGGLFFNNSYADFGGGFFAWSGFAYSNQTDVAASGFGNQFSAYHLPAGGGASGSAQFGVGFAYFRGEAAITLPAGFRPGSVRLTNVTYAALSMRDGDSFAKKFGGASGDDPDFFSVTFHGLDAGGLSTGSVEFFLADFRFPDNAQDYIVSAWTAVDLSPLGAATRTIELEFASSDVGPFGLNTPTYVALDNFTLTAVPEPSALLFLAAAIGGSGAAALVRSSEKAKSKIGSQGGSATPQGPRCGGAGRAV